MRRTSGTPAGAAMTLTGAVALPVALAVALSGCVAEAPVTPTASSSPSASPSAAAAPGVEPSGEVRDVATGLAAPWSIAQFDDGTVVLSERDTARIVRVGESGALATVTTVDAAAPAGEGGLLGLAPLEAAGERWLYAYLTAADDNRIVRLAVTGTGESLALGAPELVVAGIPKAGNHNGGRIAFGPDGMLYATAGDAGDRDAAQDPTSLAGKILRMTPDGAAPSDNPFAGSVVYSLGHRNPQGIAWDADGQLWAAEFGQNTWDELNRITAGANYGWPVVEGAGGQDGFVDPVAQWATSEASPSGLAYVGGTFFLASLRGERVWGITPDPTAETVEIEAYFVGEFGRIRDVAAGPDGALWFVTNNTDGRGDARPGDDRLVEAALRPLGEG